MSQSIEIPVDTERSKATCWHLVFQNDDGADTALVRW